MHKIIKHSVENEKIVMIIKRLPHAKVYAVTRKEQREDVGIICEGGTAEVRYCTYGDYFFLHNFNL